MRTLVYLLAALLFGGLTLWLLNGHWEKIAASSSTTGVIVGTESSRAGDRPRPIVRFTTARGEVVEQAVFRQKHTTVWNKGDALPLLYLPDDPQQVMVNEFRSLWGMVLLCGLLALGLGLMFIRRLLPASSQSQGVKDFRVLCLVPAYLAFLLVVQIMMA